MDNDTIQVFKEFGHSQLRNPDVDSSTYRVEIEDEDVHIVVHVTRNKREAICVYESAGAISKAMPSQRGK